MTRLNAGTISKPGTHRSPARLLVALAAMGLTLAACGGGAGSANDAPSTTPSTPASNPSTSTTTPPSGSGAAVTLTGQAIDGPIANANITLTAGAPIGVAGAVQIGATTANASGAYSISLTLPGNNTPIFANAVDPANPNLVLTSYVGQATDFSSGTYSDGTYPSLDITPVTTAGLALYSAPNPNDFSQLSRGAYTSGIGLYPADVMQIAAAIKVVGEKLCQPQPSAAAMTTTSLAAQIAKGSGSVSTAYHNQDQTMQTAAQTLGGNCAPALSVLPQLIGSDPILAPQIYGWNGPAMSTTAGPHGTWQLQGLLAETGIIPREVLPLTVNNLDVNALQPEFVNETLTIADDGTVSSADGKVSGSVVGNVVTLTVRSLNNYSVRGRLGVLPSIDSTGTAYPLVAGGTNTATGVAVNFPAVLSAPGATPDWNANQSATTLAWQEAQGVTCNPGAPFVMNGFINAVGGGTFTSCVNPTATAWSVSGPKSAPPGYAYLAGAAAGDNESPVFTAPIWTEVSSEPFILQASASALISNADPHATQGTAYLVMGSPFVIFTTGGGDSTLYVTWNPLSGQAVFTSSGSGN